ncbi:hypothetical protein [Sphingobium nicotianae]|uniref:Uncharacterized protein n=1 Tax=Sphingobium nicotianae TaxID=2782607 RepID=A0A9X1DG26_9SPHN|nr:hypothetical protein [Sphingobium nicotianae]MBT2189229.1 hypothetical protein [Sphingobium nicotianae]
MLRSYQRIGTNSVEMGRKHPTKNQRNSNHRMMMTGIGTPMSQSNIPLPMICSPSSFDDKRTHGPGEMFPRIARSGD